MKGHSVRGAFVGFLFGSVAGFGIAQGVVEEGDSYLSDSDLGAAIAVWAGTAVLGAALGGVIGSTQKSERWKEVDGF